MYIFIKEDDEGGEADGQKKALDVYLSFIYPCKIIIV